MFRRPSTWAVLAVLLAAAAFGLYWFAPWRLFTDRTVHDALPAIASSPATSGATRSPGNTLLAEGTLISHEHETSGLARLVRLADGRVQLLLINLITSDGPDLHVWLSDQAVRPGRDGWHVFDDGVHVELGALKANRGDQIYDVPAGTDLSRLTSVTIWCERFAVSFGAADLT